ncbi:MAG: hypothetical protein SH818_16450 [Saprospiraceae bacterium]|nr:hypothetical protein [Saprospiraceae bacterium]
MKIITTVGTSLISNSLVDCSSLDSQTFKSELFLPENDFFKTYIIKKEESLFEFIRDNGTCAELDSLKKMDSDMEAEIYLLCTETVLSFMCGRVLKKYLGERAKVQYIEGLQVKDAKKFENEGFFNLVKEVKSIKNNYADVRLNISGGYKALIPPLTLLAQLEQIPLYYLYEDSEELIETGNLPINFDWEVIEQFSTLLHNSNKRTNGTEEELSNMRKLKLVKPESCDLTIIGNLIARYSDRASPLTGTIFGYLIEHKVFECYATKYGRELVEHSVKIEGEGSEDIDVLISPEALKFIAVEIKPVSVLEDNIKMEKIKKAFINRVNAVKEKRGNPVELWLMLYSYTDSKNKTKTLSDDEHLMLNEFAKAFKQGIYTGLVFKVKHFFIEKNNLSQERHIYQTFMKTTLKPDSIKDIYSSNNL